MWSSSLALAGTPHVDSEVDVWEGLAFSADAWSADAVDAQLTDVPITDVAVVQPPRYSGARATDMHVLHGT